MKQPFSKRSGLSSVQHGLTRNKAIGAQLLANLLSASAHFLMCLNAFFPCAERPWTRPCPSCSWQLRLCRTSRSLLDGALEYGCLLANHLGRHEQTEVATDTRWGLGPLSLLDVMVSRAGSNQSLLRQVGLSPRPSIATQAASRPAASPPGGVSVRLCCTSMLCLPPQGGVRQGELHLLCRLPTVGCSSGAPVSLRWPPAVSPLWGVRQGLCFSSVATRV